MKEKKKIYSKLVAKFKILLENWGRLKPIRSLIEDMFKVAKKTFNMKDLHRHTTRFVQKYCFLTVFLIGAITAFLFAIKRDNNTWSRVKKKAPYPLFG